ncbi:MAG: ABC-F family ATP-binding cassette domain-containing protein, partial [Melioribacteraceae bacterium]
QKKKEDTQIDINNKTTEQKNTRKDQKRLEAEVRQQKFVLTKDLKTELTRCENEIKKLEELKVKLESELIDPNIFSNPQLAKGKNLSYEKTKSQLEIQYNIWTEITDKLEQIDEQFGI